MKNFIISIFLTTSLSSILMAQEIIIDSISYPMIFMNEPSDFEIYGDNHFSITAPPKSDIFISPDGNYRTDLSPRLVFKPDSDFILTAKIKPELREKWDAGVLILYNDAEHFAKFCFENDFNKQARVVSVVCNERADDCNSMIINENYVYFRIIGSTKNTTFNFYYSTDKEDWFPIRSFNLLETDNLQIGFSAQSPVGEGCKVEFSEVELQERKPIDFWKGI